MEITYDIKNDFLYLEGKQEIIFNVKQLQKELNKKKK